MTFQMLRNKKELPSEIPEIYIKIGRMETKLGIPHYFPLFLNFYLIFFKMFFVK